MDVWGDDPWADNAASTGSGRKDYETTVAPSNAVLSGFEDDAGWGDFESSNDNVWASGSWDEEISKVKEEDADNGDDQVTTAASLVSEEKEHADEIDRKAERNIEVLHEAALHKESMPQDSADEVSTQSGSTVVPDATALPTMHDEHAPEDEGTEKGEARLPHEPSARPMSSSSEATDTSESRIISSARTSFDQGLPDTHKVEGDHKERSTKGSFAPEQPDGPDEKDTAEAGLSAVVAVAAAKAKATSGPNFEVDVKLLNKLFRPRTSPKRAEESTEDLIDSTSTRKTWYRLTRPQTLRGFLSGDMDDSYVRVAWPSSGIRKDTIKIVSRWASEDRIYGKTVLGGTPKASFGWDGPSTGTTSISRKRRSVSGIRLSPISTKFSHSRQPSLSTKNAAILPSPVPQFGWSTSPLTPTFPSRSVGSTAASPVSTTTDNPWRRSIPSRPSSLQISAASLDTVFANKQKEGGSPPLLPTSAVAGPTTSSKTALTINTSTASPMVIATTREEDDDDWGEMVQSPPPPDSPATSSPKLPTIASTALLASESRSVLPVKKSRARSPVSPMLPKQAIPEGPLSPSRRAAFNAARVTRTLSSQQAGEDPSPQDDGERCEDFAEVKLGKVSTTTVHKRRASHVATLSVLEPRLPKSSEADTLHDDLSLFEPVQSNWGDSPTTRDMRSSQSTSKIAPILTPSYAQKVQNVLAQLPDLSYMFK